MLAKPNKLQVWGLGLSAIGTLLLLASALFVGRGGGSDAKD